MKQLDFSDCEHDLTFYLDMEEQVATDVKEDCFFLWRVAPTVIYGRNQNVEAEVNLDYCKQVGIKVVQRKSGGGCVYADWGNIMISYITPETDVNQVFAHYLDMVGEALKELGYNAVKTEHNDILIDGRKVSGNAFYKLPHSSIVHGTMLYNVDMQEMKQAITPSKEKLESHGVKSVRQRVVNLVELPGETPKIEDVIAALKSVFEKN